MKKNILIIGVVLLLSFFFLSSARCDTCEGQGTLKSTSRLICGSCKGKTTLRCKGYKVLRRRRFLNNNLDENHYDCKVGRYRVRENVDYFDFDGTICDNCSGTGKIECGSCDGYGYKNNSESTTHELCEGEGKVARYKNWFN